MAKWVIGYKVAEKELGEMVVDVDQCSPREHYLYLYNEEQTEPAESDSDVASIEPEALARILGCMAPGSWSFAIKTDIIEEFVLIEPEEEEG